MSTVQLDPDRPDRLIILPAVEEDSVRLMHDPRSGYVENFWLGVIGPSSVLLMRRLAAGFDLFPEGFEIDLAETAAAIGLNPSISRNGPFIRTLDRCGQFGFTSPSPYGLAVKRRLPSLSRRQIAKLPATLQAAHHDWLHVDTTVARDEHDRRRAHAVAKALLGIGDDAEEAARAITRLGLSPVVANEALAAALDQRAA